MSFDFFSNKVLLRDKYSAAKYEVLMDLLLRIQILEPTVVPTNNYGRVVILTRHDVTSKNI